MSYQRHTLVGQAEYSFVQSKNSSITLDPRELGAFAFVRHTEKQLDRAKLILQQFGISLQMVRQ